MQEEQTGKKRQEKLDWMYATPATGSNQNPNDLEDYLLGKKRVDKILTADENEKVRRISALAVLLSDIVHRSVLPIRTSSPLSMPILSATRRRRSERTLFSPSNSKSKLPIKPSCPTHSVSARCRSGMVSSRRKIRRTRKTRRTRRRNGSTRASRGQTHGHFPPTTGTGVGLVRRTATLADALPAHTTVAPAPRPPHDHGTTTTGVTITALPTDGATTVPLNGTAIMDVTRWTIK